MSILKEPNVIKDVPELEDVLSTPTDDVVQTLSELPGDILILGVGGKMGPTLGRMAKRAIEQSGADKKVIGVDRFPDEDIRTALVDDGIKTIKGDLLDREFIASLPDADNIVYMAGMKFGSTENIGLTWGVNTFLPTLVAERYQTSKISAFSTGNVYPMVPLYSGGCTEDVAPEPIGDYAQSCLGRERMFQYFSDKNNTPTTIVRLNYAVELRYGVLVDIATKIYTDQPIDVSMGYFNVIWQGDANAMILQSLALADSPTAILNVAGPEIVSTRWAANTIAELMGKEAIIVGEEAPNAFLNNAGKLHQLMGYPRVSLKQMIHWIVDWIQRDQPMINKPTHFQERKGKF